MTPAALGLVGSREALSLPCSHGAPAGHQSIDLSGTCSFQKGSQRSCSLLLAEGL